MRMGPRLPFNRVAIGFGGLLGVEEVDIDAVRTGKPAGIVGTFGEIDVQPLCDWGIFSLYTFEKPTSSDAPAATIALGAFWEPNGRCRDEQATQHVLRTGGP
jgi:hypothetical protein